MTRACQPGNVRSVTRNKRIGTAKANPTAAGGLFGLMNVPRSASQQMALNHPAAPRRMGQCCLFIRPHDINESSVPNVHRAIFDPVSRQLAKHLDFTLNPLDPGDLSANALLASVDINSEKANQSANSWRRNIGLTRRMATELFQPDDKRLLCRRNIGTPYLRVADSA